MRSVPFQTRGMPSGFDKRPCSPRNMQSVVSDLASRLGLGLSQDEVNQLVNGILAGGEAGMAIALTIASLIADANYQYSPQLVNNITQTLNQPAYFGLPVSQIIRMKIIQRRPRK